MVERTMEEVMNGIALFLDDLDQIVRRGHGMYRKYPPEILIEHTSRCAATCTYDHMVAEADRRFLEREGIRQMEIRGLRLWLIEGIAAVRFKKMDEDGRSKNYPTKQAKAFDDGDELPGLPPKPVRITAGYLSDPTGTEVLRSQISRPNGQGVLWCAAIVPLDQREPAGQAWIDVTRQRRM